MGVQVLIPNISLALNKSLNFLEPQFSYQLNRKNVQCYSEGKKKIFAEVNAAFGGRLRAFLCGAAALPPAVARGLESFGFSAPYKVLDEKLGFTGENVYKQVKNFVAE